jgi:hypothetical protein
VGFTSIHVVHTNNVGAYTKDISDFLALVPYSWFILASRVRINGSYGTNQDWQQNSHSNSYRYFGLGIALSPPDSTEMKMRET